MMINITTRALQVVIPGRECNERTRNPLCRGTGEKWIPGLRLPRKIASLFCRDGASRNDKARRVGKGARCAVPTIIHLCVDDDGGHASAFARRASVHGIALPTLHLQTKWAPQICSASPPNSLRHSGSHRQVRARNPLCRKNARRNGFRVQPCGLPRNDDQITTDSARRLCRRNFG